MLEKFKELISIFLDSPEPEVFAIHGEWGVGKTYAWNQYLKNHRESNKEYKKKYIYVSAFGVDNINQLKSKIASQQYNDLVENEKKKSFHWVSRWSLSKLSYLPKALKNISFYGVGVTTSIFDELAYSVIKNCLICIDDIERKGDGLKMTELLGFVSELKEQKNCQLVLIFNDDKFKEVDDVQYQEFREKVIDINFLFDPTPEECWELVCNNPKRNDLNDAVIKDIKSCVLKLGVNNIRILQKAVHHAGILFGLLHKYSVGVQEIAIRTLVLYTWCFYSKDDSIPERAFVLDRKWRLVDFEKKDKDTRHHLWKSILEDYGYHGPNGLDLVIAGGIDSGYFDEETVQSKAGILLEALDRIQFREQFNNDVKNSIGGSFKSNETDVLEKLKDSFYKNYKAISPHDLDYIVHVYRKLKAEKQADKFIEHYFEDQSCRYWFFSECDLSSYDRLKDEIIRSKVMSIIRCEKTEKSIKDILKDMGERKPIELSDQLVLCDLDKKGLADVLKSVEGDEFHKVMKGVRSFLSIANPSDEFIQIKKLMLATCKELSCESTLNEVRIAYHGIFD